MKIRGIKPLDITNRIQNDEWDIRAKFKNLVQDIDWQALRDMDKDP